MAFVRSALLRGWLACVLMLAGLLAMEKAQAGVTYRFGGGDVPGCTRSGTVYNCTTTALPNWDDKVVIDSGYTVNAQSSVSFSWNQGLTMSGTARLTSTGNIDLSGLNPANVVVNGGSFSAGGKFTVTGANPFKADVSAGSLTLGGGSALQLTGTMTARGDVAIGSNTTVFGSVGGGAITTNSPFRVTGAVAATGALSIASGGIIEGLASGTVVTTNSPVTLKGGVNASTRFTLASGSTVSGNITAPEVELYASGSVVTGNVTASKSLVMGSSTRIKGTVDTSQLTLQSSEAIIEGVAKVDFARLFWHGRVTEHLVCKQGTAKGKCDCVDNQSDYPVNSANGPKCEPGTPAANALDHFLIRHDASAGTCTSSSVEVTACADPACAQKFTGSTQVTMQPGNQVAVITGSGTATVSSAAKSATLSLTNGGMTPTVKCLNRQNGASDCKMAFTGDVNFDVKVPDHKAGNTVEAILRALKPNENATACVPAFTGVKPVQYSCSYVQPNSGSTKVKLEGADAFACSANGSATLNADFGADARASVKLTYPDAGKVKLNAASGDIKGSGEFTVAPYAFRMQVQAGLRAGQNFVVSLDAVNEGNTVTPNFDLAGYTDPDATKTTLSMACNGYKGTMQQVDARFNKGKATVTANFPEAGYIGLQAALKGFLGTQLNTSVMTADPASGTCQPSIGPFVPMYFQVELDDASRVRKLNDKDITFYYAREPMPLRITAMNAQGQVTANYPGAWGGNHLFALSAVAIDGKPLDAAVGTLSAALTAADFDKGVARLQASAAKPPVFQFKTAQSAPAQIRVRVENNDASGNLAEAERIRSADNAAYADKKPEAARPEIRTGRLRLATKFGSTKSVLMLPVTAEYWSGKSWMLNDWDDFTTIPATAVAQSSYPHAGARAEPGTQIFANLKLNKGQGTLPMQSAAAGWIDVAFNLGAAPQDQSCLKAHPASTGAKMPWLQAQTGCTDPSGRVTFGIFSPENRRVIHVREVFN